MTQAKRITVVLGHPDHDSFCGQLAATYSEQALANGHEVRVLRLGDLHFDPILRHGYRQRQTLEADLQYAQDSLLWAQHWALIYPIWWGGMPALLKGFFDRILLPGVAFKYREGSPLWDKLLTGRSADVITTMDTPRWYYRWFYTRPNHHQIKKTILDFCGVTTRHMYAFAPLRYADDAQRQRWLNTISNHANAL